VETIAAVLTVDQKTAVLLVLLVEIASTYRQPELAAETKTGASESPLVEDN
jgi:hypothetical protein